MSYGLKIRVSLVRIPLAPQKTSRISGGFFVSLSFKL